MTTAPIENHTGTSAALRVLVVDDNAAMLARAVAVLSNAFTVAGTAKDGPSALEAAARLHPDVIVLDISMPGMSGLEVAVALRRAGSTAEIVFLTVHEEDEFVSVAREVGGLGYVVKPRLSTDLIDAVNAVSTGQPFASPRG
jgi:DNA-binding NarL/FixJ family response regulator